MTLNAEMLKPQDIQKGVLEVETDVIIGGTGSYRVTKHAIEKKFQKVVARVYNIGAFL